MNRYFVISRRMLLASAMSILPVAAFAQEANAPVDGQAGEKAAVQLANPNEKGDATGRDLAEKLRRRGPLPFSKADVEAKAAADRAHAQAKEAGQLPPTSPSTEAPRGAAASPKVPTVTTNFAGQSGTENPAFIGGSTTPPDTTGAIGPDRYVQTVNSIVAIYTRTGTKLSQGSLNQLANVDPSVNAFDPQIIWDAQKKRFFYVMDAIFTGTDSRLAFGFSKTGSPSNVTTDWCRYTLKFGTRFPDYPKVGDSAYFLLVGVNSFDLQTDAFLGSDIVAFEKPPAGTACPTKPIAFIKRNLKDASGNVTFTPVPSNQIDSSSASPLNKGYVVARNGALPSDKLWFYKVSPSFNSEGTLDGALVSSPKGLTVGTYGVPANATQPGTTITLDTLDARPTQAMQAINPQHGKFSFWVQHTIASGSFSGVRYYEVDPTPSTGPVLLRPENTITLANTFVFNGAISSDRQRNGTTKQFGNSFVVQYNVSSSAVFPSIQVSSSVNGGALTGPTPVVTGTAFYRDFACPNAGNVCRWGDYSGAAPDPLPAPGSTGSVWGTNQYSTGGSASSAPWVTQIFNITP